MTDNASDASLEVLKTFEKVMAHVNKELEATEQATINHDHVFGVKRKCIQLGDPFHIDNLAMTWASKKAFDDPEPGNYSDLHHRQLIQSFFDIVVRDRDGCVGKCGTR